MPVPWLRSNLVIALSAILAGCAQNTGRAPSSSVEPCNRLTEAEARAYVAQAREGIHHDVRQHRELIPDAETAIALAVVVWTGIYGKERIVAQAPYQAVRVDDCWVVSGTLAYSKGGTAEAIIRIADGQFLNVTHGK